MVLIGTPAVGSTIKYVLKAVDGNGNPVEGYQFDEKLEVTNLKNSSNEGGLDEKVTFQINGITSKTVEVPPTTSINELFNTDIIDGFTTDENGELTVVVTFFNGGNVIGTDYDLHDGIGVKWYDSKGTEITVQWLSPVY